MNDQKYTGWRKSHYSNSSGACVEVAIAHRAVAVRDSKQHGHGPILELSPPQWEAFLAAAKQGEFDL